MSSRGIYVNVPQGEVAFFKQLLNRMGWAYEEKGELMDKYLQSRPQGSPLSDDEIMEETRSVRYGR